MNPNEVITKIIGNRGANAGRLLENKLFNRKLITVLGVMSLATVACNEDNAAIILGCAIGLATFFIIVNFISRYHG